jgi:hypothetical protein
MIVGSVERYEADEVKAYDPSQKRARDGRWTDENGVALPFKKTTGDDDIDAEITNIKSMSPDQYLKEAWEATDARFGGSYESWLASNKRTAKDVESYAQAMRDGDKFPLPYIDKYKGSQDGRNRALAAKEAGIDKIPVGIVEEPPVDIQIKDLKDELDSTKSKRGRFRIQEKIDKLKKLESSNVKAYDPSQKRGEAGTPQGGRWVKDDGASSSDEGGDVDRKTVNKADGSFYYSETNIQNSDGTITNVKHFEGTDKDYASRFERALSEMKERGIPVDAVKWNSAKVARTYQGQPTAISQLGKPTVVFDNQRAYDEMQEMSISSGTKPPAADDGYVGMPYLSTKDPNHTIAHETAHQLHWKALGEVERQGEALKNWQAKHWSDFHIPANDMGREVSLYAKTSPMEFVAEVYAKVKLENWKPSEGVLDLYKKLDGPKLK